MQRLGRRVLLGVLGAVFLLPGVASADLTGGSASYVSIGVGDTSMTIMGQTSPGAFVTIADFGQVIGTTSADANGVFQVTFPAQRPEIHKPSVFARDTDGVYTDTVTIPTSLYDHFDTQISFFLPPTISAAVGQVNRGDSFLSQGQTVPGSTVNLMLDSNYSVAITADSAGRWSYSWDTTNLSYGSHRVFAFATDLSSQSSYSSHALVYNLVRGSASPVTPQPSPAPAPRPSSSGQIGTPRPLSITANIPPALIPVSETRFPVRITGGQAPYRVGIDWGDGKIEEIVLDGDTTELGHRYDRPGTYSAFVYAIDADGTVRRIPLALRVQSLLLVINNGIQLLLLLLLAIFLIEHTLRAHERRERGKLSVHARSLA